MECVPQCVSCTGLCQRTVPASTLGHSSVPRRSTRTPTGYILLTCLHYTTPQEQLRTRPYKPRGAKCWCEDCSHWVKRVPVAKAASQDQEEIPF